jgi:hypothetical protein
MPSPSPGFHPAPSADEVNATKISVSKVILKNAGGIGIRVGIDGDVPKDLGLDRVKAAAERTGESVWQFPLDKREVADIKSVGGVNAGQITGGLFLEEFVAGIPWTHLDIAGTARVESDKTWRSKGELSSRRAEGVAHIRAAWGRLDARVPVS